MRDVLLVLVIGVVIFTGCSGFSGASTPTEACEPRGGTMYNLSPVNASQLEHDPVAYENLTDEEQQVFKHIQGKSGYVYDESLPDDVMEDFPWAIEANGTYYRLTDGQWDDFDC